MEDSELNGATERTARVVYRMMLGWQPTTREVAQRCNLTDSGAWYLLARISLEVPVYLDEDHRWRIVEEALQHVHYVAQACD